MASAAPFRRGQPPSSSWLPFCLSVTLLTYLTGSRLNLHFVILFLDRHPQLRLVQVPLIPPPVRARSHSGKTQNDFL